MLGFEAGQGICWHDGARNATLFGVVTSSDDSGISVVEVRALRPYIKCYMDIGADRKGDKDNVQLRDCPPPFTEIVNKTLLFCEEDRKGYAVALVNEDGNGRLHFNSDEVDTFSISVIDNGEKISESLMSEIRSHPFPGQLELEKSCGKSNARGFEAEAAFGLYSSEGTVCDIEKE